MLNKNKFKQKRERLVENQRFSSMIENAKHLSTFESRQEESEPLLMFY